MNAIKQMVARFADLDPRVRLRLGIGLASLLALGLLYSYANDQVKKLERKRTAGEADIAEMLVLKQRYKEAASISQRALNLQAAVRPDDSPAKLIEEIGIKGKALQVKPLKSEERAGFVEELADIRIDALTANEAVNLLYRLEYGAKPVTVRKALFKTRFDDPSRLDLSLTVALRKGPAAK
ncbi:general secretion pathway protein GspM [Geobacter pelophilus]|jgi:general secretion pathway protein M|uniref:General secretion pathway protein GspM n=1 Tax=Geoanaerobacter pelophilus TaxID=60036 RepID=A0AAW4L1I9_9BACT|nr:general secretion pathway protein GspM [Geoanaerobacter pelophilus]MBT0664037.1 general secretion pathway protein GspM [Geoanaerobacter pelophilus]